MTSLFDHFGNIKDPRVDRTKKHGLMDIIAITVIGVLGGAEGWDSIVVFAQAREQWLQRFCDLSSGVPSADTLRRVVSRIDPKEFENAFRSWVACTSGKVKGLVAVDGKTICNKRDSSPLHILSAYSDHFGVCVGQISTGEKGGEYEAIPKLLKDLDIAGCLITIDAAGCYKEIAEKTVYETKADYLFQVKGNQPVLHSELTSYFEECDGSIVDGARRNIHQSKEHGRHEKRIAYYSDNVSALPSLTEWCGAASFGLIIRERELKGKVSISRHYYICSRKLSASKLATYCRAHWGIENSLHWVLDMTFGEDGNRIHSDQGQENLALARKIALNILKNDDSKLSIKQRKFRAGIDESYMAKLLGNSGI